LDLLKNAKTLHKKRLFIFPSRDSPTPAKLLRGLNSPQTAFISYGSTIKVLSTFYISYTSLLTSWPTHERSATSSLLGTPFFYQTFQASPPDRIQVPLARSHRIQRPSQALTFSEMSSCLGYGPHALSFFLCIGFRPLTHIDISATLFILSSSPFDVLWKTLAKASRRETGFHGLVADVQKRG
jgi:hypothetical protein